MSLLLPPRLDWPESSQAAVAEFFGISLTALKSGWVARGCPLTPRPHGDGTAYDLSEIARWRIQYERSKKPQMSEADALMSALTGPGGEDWKERWLRAKAILAEEQLAEVQGKLVDLDELAPMLRRTGTLLADAIRRLEAEYGFAAADIMRTPLERMSEEVEGMLERGTPPTQI